MANNTFLPTGFTVTSTFATLASYLDAAGINTDQSPVTSQNGYIKNNSTSISLYIGQGTSAPSSWATLAPESAILFNAGLNTSLIWIKAASSTVTADFVEGADEYAPPTINGVIGTITANEGVVPMADADGNLIASSISDDGAGTVSIASDVTATGTVTSDDATTPAFIVASGNTNTGYIDVFGKTSGKIRITTADATAQTINITAAAQTSGAGTITIPDLAGASTAPMFTGLTQTVTGVKTFTTPVLGVASATSLATSAATPLKLTNGQLVDIALTSQTVGATTLTIPDFASVVDEFTFKTKAQTMSNKAFVAPVLGVATGTSLAVTGLLTSSGTAGIGYATGAGGAQTQATDKSTTVVSNTITTAITMNNAALNTDTAVSFTFTNSTIAATDQVVVTHQSAGTSGAYVCNAFPGAGSAVITVRNVSTGNLSEAIVLRVSVYKAVSA